MREYDVRVKGRPILSKEVGEKYLSKVDMSYCSNYIFTAAQDGKIFQQDLRKGKFLINSFLDLSVVKVLTGGSGSIRDLKCHPTLPLLGCCCLDRFFRLIDYENKDLIGKIYTKQIPNCFIFTEEGLETEEEKKEECKEEKEDVEEEDEEEKEIKREEAIMREKEKEETELKKQEIEKRVVKLFNKKYKKNTGNKRKKFNK